MAKVECVYYIFRKIKILIRGVDNDGNIARVCYTRTAHVGLTQLFDERTSREETMAATRWKTYAGKRRSRGRSGGFRGERPRLRVGKYPLST